jgi:hypothetical protein
MTDTPNLALPLIAAAQAQKHVTHNEALALLDAVVQMSVDSRTLSAPPSTPAEGARYLVPAGATGAFAGKATQIALFDGGGWRFLPPKPGWIAYVAAENIVLVWTGVAWTALGQAIGGIDQLAALGIGTASDPVNRLSVRAQGALMSALRMAASGTGDMRLTLEKETAAHTGSLVFQTNYSGRAEIGLMGDDAFRVKVSADGSLWRDALLVNGATGQVSFPNGVSGLSGGAGALGQCRLDLAAGALRLMPRNGNLLSVNGAAATVPASGVTLAAAGLAANTTYYIYAVASDGAVTALEASTTGWAVHSDGTAIKAGDASRALVGMARTIAGPAFADTPKQRFVASWFNRPPRALTAAATADRSTSSTSYVEVSQDFRVEYVGWGDSAVSIAASGATYNNTAGTANRFSFGVDSAAATEAWCYVINFNATQFQGFGLAGSAQPDEGYHYITLLMNVTAGTGTVGGSATPGARSVLNAMILP